jgi:hypothetical protein
MLQYKARSEQLKQEKTNLTVAYEVSQHSHMEDCLPPPPRQVVNMASLNFGLKTTYPRTMWVISLHWNS